MLKIHVRRVVIGAAVLLLILSFGYREYCKQALLNDGLMHIYFLNIGQGDGFLIKTPDRRIIVIDGGPDESVLFRLGRILPFWVRKIDVLVLSHFHRDHYMGAYYLSRYFEVKNILYGKQSETDKELELLFNGFKSGGKNQFIYLSEGKNVFEETYGLVNMKAWSPVSMIKPINENYETNFVSFSYKNFDVLFTGDAPPSLQKAAQADLKSKKIEVLKVPHQGSRYDLYPPLNEQLKPEFAVISVGQNSYGHPHPDVLEYYKKVGVQLGRTDEVIDYILIKTDGEEYKISYH